MDNQLVKFIEVQVEEKVAEIDNLVKKHTELIKKDVPIGDRLKVSFKINDRIGYVAALNDILKFLYKKST